MIYTVTTHTRTRTRTRTRIRTHAQHQVYGDKGEDMFLPPSLAAPLAFLEVGNVWGEDEEDEEEEMGGLRRLAGMFGQY